MRKLICILWLFYASFLYASPTCIASNVTTFKKCLEDVDPNGTIKVNPGTYVGKEFIIDKNMTIVGNGANREDVLFENDSSAAAGHSIFHIQNSALHVTFENLSVHSTVLPAEIDPEKDNNGEYRFINVDLEKDSGYVHAAILTRKKVGKIYVSDSKIKSDRIQALNVKANDVFVTKSEILGRLDGVGVVEANKVVIEKSTITTTNGGSGVNGVNTAPISIKKANDVYINNVYLNNKEDTIGTKNISLDEVDNAHLNFVCMQGGYQNIEVNNPNIVIQNSRFSIYANAGYKFDNGTISTASGNCFFGNQPLRGNVDGNTQFDGNYWDYNTGNDTNPLTSCPITSCATVELVSELRFDECRLHDGITTSNEIDTAFNGVLSGLAATDPVYEERKLCNGLTFFENGQGVVEIPNISNVLNKTASLVFWIRTTQIGETRPRNSPVLFGKDVSRSTNDIFWGWIDDDGHIGITTGNDENAKTTTPINDGFWHHVVLIRNSISNDYKIYLDGVLNKSGTIDSPVPDLSSVTYSKLGKNEGINEGYFTGSLDELKIYNGEINASVVNEIYTNENSGKNYDGTTRTCTPCNTPETCYTDSFDNGIQDTWKVISSQNYTPTNVNNRLRLTNTRGNVATGVTLNGSLPSTNNIFLVDFDHFAYGGSGADGLVMVLSDANVTTAIGAPGGSLGYAQRTRNNKPGFAGGWLGMGLDEYGNFSRASEGRIGGPGRIRDSVSIRGSEANNYRYLAGTGRLSPGIDDNSAGRKYRLAVDTRDNKLATTSRKEGSRWRRLANFNAEQTGITPTDLQLSFTASTGGSTNYHEIDSLNFYALNCGTLGEKYFTFDAWDIFREIDDRNISTKIVNDEFNLKVVALDQEGIAPLDFNGTVCARLVDENNSSLTSGWKRWYANDANTTIFNFNETKAQKNAKVKFLWKKNENIVCPIASGNETNTSLSTDNFAIRPKNFDIQAPLGIQVSETTIDLEFFGKDANDDNTTDYNETKGTSFKSSIDESSMSKCYTDTTSFNSNWSFNDGYKAVPLTTTKSGDLKVWISDENVTCNSLFAAVDCKDKNIPGSFDNNIDTRIGKKELTITWQCPVKYFDFDGWDIFRSGIDDKNISTKEVQENFDINISSFDENRTNDQNFTGTLCLSVGANDNNITQWQQLIWDNEQSKKISFTVPIAKKDAKVLFKWKPLDTNATCPIDSNDTNITSSSTDNFAIKPNRYVISNPNNEIVSGEKFGIDFYAKDLNNQNTLSYNEQINDTFQVRWTEKNTKECENGPSTFEIWSFLNGYRQANQTINKSGIFEILISDENLTCDTRFAAVDCADKNVTNFFNSDTNTTITAAKANVELKCEKKDFKFDAWDIFRDIDDRNISTKIVNENFKLTIAALDEFGADYQDFNGTVCVQILSSGMPLTNNWKHWSARDENKTNLDFTVPVANKNARVKIVWKLDVNEGCPLTDESNTTLSSDNFAIRPAQFSITAPNTAKSGDDINISFAGLDIKDKASQEYNETQSTTFKVEFQERKKATCPTGVFDIDILGFTFVDGNKTIQNTSYNDVGVIDINISDTVLTCNERYAAVDCDDKDINGKWNSLIDTAIGDDNVTITFIPHHFDINSTLQNFQDSGFTYLSNDVNQMNAPLTIDIKAKNNDGEVTANYTPLCYAKPIDLNITYAHTSIFPNNLTLFLYHETNTSQENNITLDNTVNLNDIPTSVFNDGNATLVFKINFDRNYTAPVNPFDINITDINVTDEDSVSEVNENNDGNATFYYGRIMPKDITTTSSTSQTYAQIEVYNTNTNNYTSSMLQNSLYWYRNRLHTNAMGMLTNPQDSEFKKSVPFPTSILNTTTGISVNNGVQNIIINANNPTNSIKRTIHFEVAPWLWYTEAANGQEYDKDGSCLRHPCLSYEYFKNISNTKIQSGDFQGSDVNISNLEINTTQNRGIKVFR